MNIFAAILLCLAAATQAKPVVICEQGNLSPSCNAYCEARADELHMLEETRDV